jgi:hypothetical protein
MKETQGRVYSILPDGRALIATALPDGTDDEVRVLWPDKDEITPEQRRKIFAINGEIAIWSGHDPEYQRKNLTFDFLRTNLERLQMTSLSLATSGNCDKGTASLFIDFLVEFCMEHNVPTKGLMEYAEDIEKYTYSAMLHKRCLICGGKAEIHHVDAIGMGYNRREKPQIGNRVMPLCRNHHMEWHNIGGTAFEDKYHVVPVKLDQRLADKYNLTKKAKEEKE